MVQAGQDRARALHTFNHKKTLHKSPSWSGGEALSQLIAGQARQCC